MKRIFVVLFFVLYSLALFGENRFLSSFVVGGNVCYSHFLLTEGEFSFSLLGSTKTNVLFSFSYTNEELKLYAGDNYFFFGNGLVLGNPRYRYFRNYLFSQKFVSNGVYMFDFYRNDRNFDGKVDVPKGVYLGKWFGNLVVWPFFFENFEGEICGGIALDYSFLGGLFFLSDNLYVSVSTKEVNFLGLGVVFSGEVAVSLGLANSNLGFGFSGTMEWYVGKFQFSLSANSLSEVFGSPYGSSFYSTSNKSGVIFSVVYSDGNKFNFYGVSKILVFESGTEDEFSFYVIKKLIRNLFLDLEVSDEQGYLFFSLYPYFDNEIFEFYVKPKVAVNEDFYRDFCFSCTVEGGAELKFSGFDIGAKTFVPISQAIPYFTFVSTVVRDSFGENEDIKVLFDSTSFLAFARIISKGFKGFSLSFDFNLELDYLVDLFGKQTCRFVANFRF